MVYKVYSKLNSNSDLVMEFNVLVAILSTANKCATFLMEKEISFSTTGYHNQFKQQFY
mgnify:CR=1 FL=1